MNKDEIYTQLLTNIVSSMAYTQDQITTILRTLPQCPNNEIYGGKQFLQMALNNLNQLKYIIDKEKKEKEE